MDINTTSIKLFKQWNYHRKTETSIKVEHTFKNLKGDIKDFDDVEKDINNYIEEKVSSLNKAAKYNLSK